MSDYNLVKFKREGLKAGIYHRRGMNPLTCFSLRVGDTIMTSILRYRGYYNDINTKV